MAPATLPQGGQSRIWSGPVLITGATGFLGSSVLDRLLSTGERVFCLVRSGSSRLTQLSADPSVRVIQGDVSSVNSWRMGLPDPGPPILIHLAWHAKPPHYLSDPANLEDLSQSLRLFRAAQEWGCRRIVSVGSCFEYDTTYGYLSEIVPIQPRSLYAAAKAALFFASSAWAREANISLLWPRLFHLYGPREHPGRLVPSIVTALLSGERIGTTRGRQVRDYLHVEDAARIISSLAFTAETGPINVASGEPVRVAEIVSRIGSLLGRSELIDWGALSDRPDDPPFICANVERLREAVGLLRIHNLTGGLERTVDWWRRTMVEESRNG